MPNWVAHCITVKGPSAELKRMCETVFVEDESRESLRFDFNTLIPKSPELDIEDGSTTYLADEIFNLYANSILHTGYIMADMIEFDQMPNRLHVGEHTNELRQRLAEVSDATGKLEVVREFARKYAPHLEETAKICESNRSKYGHATWYNWCCANWGSKWNACDTHIQTEGAYDDSDTPDELAWSFDTAWGHVEPIMAKLAEMFPLVTFEVWFFDEGHNFCGYGRAGGGEYTVDRYNQPSMKNPLMCKIYEETYGCDYHTEEDEDVDSGTEGVTGVTPGEASPAPAR